MGRAGNRSADDQQSHRPDLRKKWGTVDNATAIWLQTMVPLNAGHTVELQGTLRAADGYFMVERTPFVGAKIGGGWQA